MEFMNKQLSIHDAKLSEIENRPQKRLGKINKATYENVLKEKRKYIEEKYNIKEVILRIFSQKT